MTYDPEWLDMGGHLPDGFHRIVVDDVDNEVFHELSTDASTTDPWMLPPIFGEAVWS